MLCQRKSCACEGAERPSCWRRYQHAPTLSITPTLSHRQVKPSQRSKERLLPPLLPRRLLEHFRPVPSQKLRMRKAFLALRLNQAGAVMSQQLRFSVVAAHQVAAEHDLVVPRQHGERAEVEDLVVEGTKREAVLHHVRPAGLEPLDVRGFEAQTLPPIRGRPCAGRARRRSSCGSELARECIGNCGSELARECITATVGASLL